MSRDKAQQLIALLGDRAEPVLSLLSEENASFLREQKIDIQTISDDAIESIFYNLQETKTDEVAPEPEVDDSLELEEDEVTDDELDFEEEDVSDSFDFEEAPSLEAEDDNFKPIADTLQEQDPALVAFFLKKLEDDKRESILSHMSYEFKDSIDQFDVKDLPISNEIFEQLYNELFKDWN